MFCLGLFGVFCLSRITLKVMEEEGFGPINSWLVLGVIWILVPRIFLRWRQKFPEQWNLESTNKKHLLRYLLLFVKWCADRPGMAVMWYRCERPQCLLFSRCYSHPFILLLFHTFADNTDLHCRWPVMHNEMLVSVVGYIHNIFDFSGPAA